MQLLPQASTRVETVQREGIISPSVGDSDLLSQGILDPPPSGTNGSDSNLNENRKNESPSSSSETRNSSIGSINELVVEVRCNVCEYKCKHCNHTYVKSKEEIFSVSCGGNPIDSNELYRFQPKELITDAQFEAMMYYLDKQLKDEVSSNSIPHILLLFIHLQYLLHL